MKTIKFFTVSLFTAVLIFISNPVSAQFGFGVGFGAQQMNVSKLNKFNKSNSLPEINQLQYLSTLAFFIGTKRYFLEVNREMASGTAENSTHMLENSSHFAVMNFAYNLSKNEKHRFYPLAGFGYGYQNLNFTEKTGGAITFTDFIQSQAKTHSIRNERVIIRLGGGWMYRLGPSDPEKKTMGESIGLQFGYNLPVYQAAWKTADLQKVNDVPEINNQGFYAKVSLQFF